MEKKTHWHLMSWQEIRDAAKENPTILVPAGTTETQGPYTYVGIEFVLPERLAKAVARRSNALVAPTIPFGYSPDFEDFPGTITLSPSVIARVYEEVVISILRHGFDHILFLVTHGPNQPMIEEVAFKIREEFGVLVAWFNPGRLASKLLQEVSPNYDEARGHGADPALSLSKYLEPNMVDLTNMAPNEWSQEYQNVEFVGGPSLLFDGFEVNMPIKLQDISPVTGGFGDPRHASEDQGEQIFVKMVDYVDSLVQQFSKMNTHITK